jgi:hypothetical protein
MKRKSALISLAVAAALALVATAVPASAATLRAIDGFDVSYPQCGRSLPAPGAFTIIGIDGGRVFRDREANDSTSACLVNQLKWAKNAGSRIQLYANTGNPGGPVIHDITGGSPVDLTIANWPSNAGVRAYPTNPRPCYEDPTTTTVYEADTVECAYDYGYRAAWDSFRRAKAAFASAGITYSPASVNWWLDLEEGNTWRGHDDGYVHPNDANLTTEELDARNIASMRGAHDFLVSVADVKQLGFYGSPNAWATIMAGTTRFADHPFWYPIGTATNADAVARCAAWVNNVTGSGQPAMVQYIDAALDLDMSVKCYPKSVLTYTGGPTVSKRAKFTLSVKLSGRTSSIGLHGQKVSFSYRGKTYSARTDSRGVARVSNVVAPSTSGRVWVKVTYATNSYSSKFLSTAITVR